MIGCDFCDMWYHPECLGLDQEQAISLTKSDWMCPECEDKKCNSSKRGRPKQKVKPLRESSDSEDHSMIKERKQTSRKEKESSKVNSKQKVTTKNLRDKKQSISKKYISDKDTSDTEDNAIEQTSKKSSKKYVSNPSKESTKHPIKKVGSLKTQQVAQKENESLKRSFSTSDSLSNSDDDLSSLEGSPSIIRIPMDASQLD